MRQFGEDRARRRAMRKADKEKARAAELLATIAVVPAFMRPVADALARGEMVRLLTWDEQRRLQRAAYAHAMAKRRAMLLLMSMQDKPTIIVNDDPKE